MGKKTHNHGAMASTPWGLKSCLNSLLALLSVLMSVLMISVALSYTARPPLWYLSTTSPMGSRASSHGKHATNASTKVESVVNMKTGCNRRLQTCDLFDGRWVYDPSTRPSYSGLGCSFLPDELACDKYGRKDTAYQHQRWQPHGCDIPRFNGTKLLESLRGKRMLFVGDSLNRNQWASMVCLLESSIPATHKTIDSKGSLLSFKAKSYNVSIDFYWAPLLLESNCDNPRYHRESLRIIRSQSIEKHARHWADADILVFNSYVWWLKPRIKLKVLYGSFTDENVAYDEMELKQGFKLALETWSNWLQFHIETQKKLIYFVSLSPSHNWGEDWGAARKQNCYNETEPIDKVGHMGSGSDVSMMRKVEETIKLLRDRGVNVHLLNITQLSEYRKDGHPSIYKKHWDPLSQEQLANPATYSDCIHWCLPGVPDTWNQLLYAHIFQEQSRCKTTSI